MLTGIFSAITLLLKLFNLWDLFVEHVDATRRSERILKDKERGEALSDAAQVTTPEDAFKDEERIVNAKP